jgi:hypothetical protein
VRGWRLLTKRDMRKFKNLREDGLLGPGGYGIFEDWLAMKKSQEKYICIKDGLILEGEVQDMNDEENFYDEGPYKERVCGFSWRTTRWLLIIAGSCIARQTLSVFLSLR